MPFYDKHDAAERDTLKVRLSLLVDALQLVGLETYRNELCTCDPEWSSHGPRCIWNTAQELLPDVAKYLGGITR